jgi:2-polyprenyl-3-methyl-5-hydroxy-6-metoxy-1,4-benzoquinol methylase
LRYFVKPLVDIYSSVEGPDYYRQFRTYSEYNYLRPGVSSRIKTRHFEVALKLTRRHFRSCNVIDFGCADGVFLPSLSRYFNHVVGIDNNPQFITICETLLRKLDLTNVELVCNDSLTLSGLSQRVSGRSYDILYLLETLEHVGDRDSPYESRIHFLREIATLIADDGMIVLSVPKMVGVSFLVQHIGLAALGLAREEISLSNLLKASFLNNTVDLEKEWDHFKHLGFSHKKLESYLSSAFQILRRKELAFQVVYIIAKPRTCTA